MNKNIPSKNTQNKYEDLDFNYYLKKKNKFIEIEKISKNLLNNNIEIPDFNIILICGIPGVGKTYLTKVFQCLLSEKYDKVNQFSI